MDELRSLLDTHVSAMARHEQITESADDAQEALEEARDDVQAYLAEKRAKLLLDMRDARAVRVYSTYGPMYVVSRDEIIIVE